MGSEVKELEERLKKLKQNIAEKEKVKQLKKQIRATEFSQTKTGKFFGAVGRVGEKILTAPPQSKGKKKKKSMNVQDVINNLPA